MVHMLVRDRGQLGEQGHDQGTVGEGMGNSFAAAIAWVGEVTCKIVMGVGEQAGVVGRDGAQSGGAAKTAWG